MQRVASTKVTTDFKSAVKEVVDQFGGFKKFVKQGEVVLLIPNLNTADPPPASSGVDSVKALVELIYEQEAKSVIVGVSSTYSANTQKEIEKARYTELCDMDQTPRLLNFDKRKWVKKEIPKGKYLKSVSVPEILGSVDKVILLPCLKTHYLAQFTGALKLSVGLMKPSERIRLHLSRLQEKIAELNTIIEPDLIVMDGRKCFINDGPSHGELAEPNIVLASTSRTAIDIEGIKIIQGFEGNDLADFDAEEITQIKLARELGVD